MKAICNSKIILLSVLGMIVFCGCEFIDAVNQPGPPNERDTTPLRVTMVYPNDCVSTAAYCQGFHIGLKEAEAEYGIHLTEVNGMENDPVATEMIMREAAQNSDLVLAAGYQLGEAVATIAPEFPYVKFAMFDFKVAIPNVASVNYKANEGSFLVGAIAALKTKSNKIGFIGGVDIPLIQGFAAGYIAGILEINPEADISVDYVSEDESGFTQPDKAKQIALAQYASGVDVIYVAAGGSGQGVLEAAQEQSKYIIWVDDNGNHLAPGTVLTSMAKEIPASVKIIIREALEDRFMGGIRYFGLEDGGVYYAVDEHNRNLLSDEIIESVESLKAKIISGEIVVPNLFPQHVPF